MLVSCCTNPNLKKRTRHVLVPARTTEKLLLGWSTGKIKSNPLEPHLETSATTSQSLDGTETAVALPHYSENTTSPSPGVAFSDQRCGWSYGTMTGCRTIIIHTAVEVLPVADLCKKIGEKTFCVGGATQVRVSQEC